MQTKWNWDHESHHPHQCLYSKKYELCYIPIPKVASSSIKNALQWKDYNDFDDIKYNIKNFIVVLRDPIERWESAMNMFIRDDYYKSDEHTEQYSYFLQNVPFNKILFFYLTPTILQDISTYFNIPMNTNITLNASKKAIKILDRSIIEKTYATDIKFMNAINFVNI